ncbi:MAG: cytochrome-c peroxidase [bacterium]|nr:cytochrome-c peroxidase [bacterium]
MTLFSFCSLCTEVGAADDLMKKSQALFQPIPATSPAIEQNKSTPEKVALGKMLFFEPRLSASALISCNTCHNVGMGGDDFQETSIGHGWQKGPRNAPTVLNSVFNVAQFWDGRAPDLREQAKGPVQAAVEMNNLPEKVIETLKSMPEYPARFEKAFPGEQEPVTFDNMARAIEVFEATLITPDAPFDKFLRGDGKALTAAEQEGLQQFISKGCATCHGGMNMGGSGYFPFGLVKRPTESIMAGDKGRYEVTQSESDQFFFKSPSLRNIALTPPYFHSGKVWDLAEAVTIMGDAQLGLSLSREEAEKVVVFLRATTGTQPRIEYPILPPSTERTPKPKID